MSRHLSVFSWPLLALMALSCLGRPASASTLTVPAQYATIQAAINASQSGDTVLLSDGTYTGPGNVDLSFGGRNITVDSQHGAAKTIIDCQGSSSANHRGFYLHGGETRAVISGLTIQNGYEDIYSSYIFGGGIWNSGVSVTIQNCILKNNVASYGGGIDNSDCGAVTVTNCIITGNHATGINNVNSSPLTVTNCTFTGNGSGGVYSYTPNGVPAALTNDILYGDSTNEIGTYSSVTATNCDIQGGLTGTGNINADPLFFNASADVHLRADSPCLGAGTARGAPATALDGQVRPDPPSMGAYELVPAGTTAATTTTLTSSGSPSFSGQTVVFYASVKRVGNLPTGTITFTIDGVAQAPVPLSNGYDVNYALSSLSVGSHTVTATYGGDATFAPSTSPALTQTVIAHISPHYVSPSGSDTNPGTSALPKLTIQAAINATLSGDTVLLGDGAYTGPGDVDLDFGGRRLTVTSQNGAVSTIIDCQGSRAANHRAFYLHSYESGAVISGLTIENGYRGSGGAYDDGNGGAIYNSSVGLTVRDCVFKNNTAGNGGGIFNSGYNNTTGNNTGLISVIHCAFTGNFANYGGGISNHSANGGTLVLTGCILTNNVANGGGGGINTYNDTGGALAMTNCILSGNTAPYGGGIETGYNYNSNGGTVTITSCTLTGNSATSGGGIYATYRSTDGGTFALTNDILYGDIGGEIGGQISSPTMSLPATYCDIQYGYLGAGNINADPLFYDTPTDLHLQAGSPCLGAGTTAGSPATTIDGRTRPTPPSIGAYEAAVTGVAATTTTLTSSLNPSFNGQSVTFTVVVAGQGNTPTGAVTFSINGTAWAHMTLSGGKATYTTSFLPTGSQLITAGYTGDVDYAPGKSLPLRQTVQAIPTTTTLASSLNPSVYAQEVIFTAKVTGGSSPAGNVILTDMASGIVLDSTDLISGIATFYVSDLPGGNHHLVASYRGDGRSASSASNTLLQIVTKAGTATTVTSSLSPSLGSQAVTFTASVTKAAGVPTGTVTFTVDGTPQTSVALSSGYSAVYTTSGLATGSHTVTATYNGDTNYTPSVSSPLTQTVIAHVSPHYVSPSGSDSNPGTQAAPKLTIQAAINATLSGDTVVVEDGTYTGPGDVDLNFGGRNITVTSQNGAASTIIDCGGNAFTNHRGFYLNNAETNAVISGLTIENGYEGNSGAFGGGNGGAIYSSATGLTVQECVLMNNTVAGGLGGGFGGGVFSSPQNNGVFTMVNCVLAGNLANSGGGLYAATTLNAITVNSCTFTGNSARQGSGVFSSDPGFPVKAGGGSFTLTDDILYGDTGGECGYTGTAIAASYCDIQGGYLGTGNFDADPLFVAAPTNLHLQAGSPCLGAGTSAGAPAADLDGSPRRDPPSLGAYEYAFVPPVAVAQNVTTAQNTPVALTLSGSDPNLLPLLYTLVSGPAHGTLSGSAPNLTYTPAPGYSGSDGFQFTVRNSFAVSAPAAVGLSVTPAPIVLSALTFPASVPGGTVVTATVTLSGITPVDVVVGLSSSDSSVVRVHRAVIVPAGASSATFAINTYRSQVTQTVTIQATLGQVVKTAPLTITGG